MTRQRFVLSVVALVLNCLPFDCYEFVRSQHGRLKTVAGHCGRHGLVQVHPLPPSTY